MRKRPTARAGRWTLATLVAIVGIGVVVSAGAAERPKSSSRTETPEPQARASIAATCPDGRKPISGGFQVALPSSMNDLAIYVNDFMAVDGKRWRINTVNLLDPAPFTTIAYCSKLGRQIEVRRAETTLDQGTTDQATARCKRNERVISGGYGFASQSGGLTGVRSSFRDGDRSWTVSAANVSENDVTVTLVTFANCLPERTAPSISTSKKSEQVNGFGTPTAKCGRHKKVMAGGFRVGSPTEVPIFFGSSRAGNEKWKVLVNTASSTKFTTFAYCAK